CAESAADVESSEGVGQVEDRLVRGFWIDELEASPGDSGGAVYQGGNAIGLVSGGSDAGVWAADLEDALSYTGGYEVRLFVEAPEKIGRASCREREHIEMGTGSESE